MPPSESLDTTINAKTDIPPSRALLGHLARFLVLRIGRLLELRALIAHLVAHDLQTQFAGSVIGAVWSVIHPLVMALVLWFVFAFGVRSAPIEDVPFHVWLFCGIFPWTYFSTAVSGACTSLQEQSYLVKQPDFCIAVVPIVRVFSTLLIHFAFLVILVVFALTAGIAPSIHWLQFLYYTGSLTILCIGFAWLVSSLHLFLRDTAQIVNVLLQLGFWLTPIFWNPENMPAMFTRHLALNPAAYIIAGYRASLFGTGWFWESPAAAGIFWAETIVVFAAGLFVFRRLRPQFLDLL